MFRKGTRTLLERFPAIARQWHPTKNGSLGPSDVASKQAVKVWWKCPKGADHEWQAQVFSRAHFQSGCPFCSGRRGSRGHSLAQSSPALARQWHPTKNGELRPSDVSPASNRLVWWKCTKVPDHEWQGRIHVRRRNPACPYCAGFRTSKQHSLATVSPKLASEWHPTRNGKLRASDVLPRSARSVWWLCAKSDEHEWRAPPARRARSPRCPFCWGLRVARGDSLAALRPDVARLWHPERNRPLLPWQVLPRLARILWWYCDKGPDHEWCGSVSQVVRNRRCPFCANLRVSVTNSLARLEPRLARQWHPTKNDGLSAADVLAVSKQLAWWQCPEGPDHVWRARISRRITDPGCPFCKGLLFSVTNSLAARYPRIAAEWHRVKNGKKTPKNVLATSREGAWWSCPLGHSYQTRIRERTSAGRGCPVCAGALERRRSTE